MSIRDIDRAFGEARRLFRRTLREVRRLDAKIVKSKTWLKKRGTQPLDRPSPEFAAWTRMVAQFKNPRAKNYYNYATRGIRLDPRWQSFTHFLLDVGLRPARGYVLTRINVNGNFTSSNVRWAATSQMPLRKRPRNSRLTIFDGELRSLRTLGREFGLEYPALHARIIRRCQPVAQAIEELQRPPRICRCPDHAGASQCRNASSFKEVEDFDGLD